MPKTLRLMRRPRHSVMPKYFTVEVDVGGAFAGTVDAVIGVVKAVDVVAVEEVEVPGPDAVVMFDTAAASVTLLLLWTAMLILTSLVLGVGGTLQVGPQNLEGFTA